MMEQSVKGGNLIQLIKCCPRHQLEVRERERERECSDKSNTAVKHHQHDTVPVLIPAMTTHERFSLKRLLQFPRPSLSDGEGG